MDNVKHYLSPRMGRVEQIHFVGIGGSGMCGIAEVLHNEGYRVTGSDSSESKVIDRLRALGIQIFQEHAQDNISGADVVVRSTAIEDDNPEIMAARAQSIPVIPRALMLAELMRFRHGIAIAGTHGKTTTTSLVSSLLAQGGLDPSFVIGGKLNSSGSNANLGDSPYFVAEADESDASFLFLKPMMAVVTNIDADHMSTYGDSFERLQQTFLKFLHHLPFYGLAVLCVDDETVANLIPQIQRPIVTYGFKEDAQYRAVNWQQTEMMSQFTVIRPRGLGNLTIQFQLPGQHNVLNALAAIAIASELNVSDEAIESGLAAFQGVGRRFQILGEKAFSKGKALVIDDYGHHPKEIQSTLDAFRAVWPQKRLVHVFQPHRYSRTKELFDQFVHTLSLADELLMLDIYAAGEQPIPGISSDALLKEIKVLQPRAMLVTVDTLSQVLDSVVEQDAAILMQGAGSIGQLAQRLMQTVQEQPA